MTPSRAPGIADATRPPLWLLLIPAGIILVVAGLTPTAELHPNQGDVNLYLDKAIAVTSGLVPYRDLGLEYPPLALVPMVVPYLVWPFGAVNLDLYKWLFAGWEAVLMVLLGLVLARIVRLRTLADPDAAAARPIRNRLMALGLRLVFLTAGAAVALAWRFDLFPALLAVAALWAALAGRPGLAGVAVAAGVLAKLFPVVLIPALAVPWLVPLDWGRLLRFGGAIWVTLLAGLLPFVAVAGTGAFSFLSYQALRGLQIESTGGGLVLLDGLLRGRPVELDSPFSAVEVTGPLASALLAVLPLLMLAAFGVLAWAGWRRIRAEQARHGRVAPATVVLLAAASIFVLIATSKVFSIQYVVWIVPFAALLSTRQFWLATAMVALTMPIHPFLYGELVEQAALPVLILNLRNALLVVLTCWVIWDLRPARMPSARPASATGPRRGALPA